MPGPRRMITTTKINPVNAQPILTKVILLIDLLAGIVAFALSSQGSFRFSGSKSSSLK